MARVLTFLFSDLVGSTETLARLGESRAEEVRRVYFGLLRSAIAAGAGREVKSLGDGVMVVFDSPSDAVACAVAMQRALERHNARGGERLDVRIGLQVGEATEGDEQPEDGDYFGGPVVEARRLCDAALGGQILVSSLVQALAAARTGFSFTPVGLLSLQGLPQPVAAFEVGYEPLRTSQLPLPPELAVRSDGASAFVGRSGECERLHDLWRRAEIGDRQLAFVTGEPGIGKTRLVAELARMLHGDGAGVLWGRSFEEALIPYQPVVQALRHYVGSCGAEELRRRLPPDAGSLVRLLPELQARVPAMQVAAGGDPESERYRLFEAIASLLIEVSADMPLLLVLDDVQWADRGTLLLLKSIALDPRPASLLILGTYRDSEVTRSHPLHQLQADIQRDRPVELVELSGLAEADVARLVDSLLGFAVPSEVADELWSETEGNPFFLEEVVRHLGQFGGASPDNLRRIRLFVEERGVPRRVKQLVGRRLQRLSPAAFEALSVGAVIGSVFRLELLAAVLGDPQEGLVTRMDEAVAAQLLNEVPGRLGEYGFSHALIQQALYEELSLNRRAALHERTAASLERLWPDAPHLHAEITYHYGRAGERHAGKVVRHGRAAGEHALELLAYEDAIREFSAALAALDRLPARDPAERAELLSLLGSAQTRAGDAPAAQQTFHQAAELSASAGAWQTLAQAVLGYGGGAGFGGVWDRFATVDAELVRLLEQALASCPAASHEHVRLLGRLAQALYWSPENERALRLSEEAVSAARQLGDRAALAYALDSRHVALWSPDHLEERARLADEMLELGRELGDREIQLEALAWLATDTLERGSIAAVDELVAAQARIAGELRQPYHLWYTDALQAMRAHLDGRFAEAAELCQRAYESGKQAHGANALQTYLVQTMLVKLDQGELDDLIEELARYVPDSPLDAWRAAFALALAGLDRREEALEQVRWFAEGGFSSVPRDCIWMTTMVSLGRTVGHFDDPTYADELYELLSPFADRVCVVGGAVLCLGPISRILGMLARAAGRPGDALWHFADAIERSRALGSPPLVARTQVEAAKAHLLRRSADDTTVAQRLLGKASETASALGMGKLQHDIAVLQGSLERTVLV